MHILVVDDDRHIREIVRFALERAGHRVCEAADGHEALVAHARDPADLVVLDILMPEMDGIEVCRQLRSRSEVPILFLSSRSDEIDRILGLELGADDYVTKPFSPRELVARVRGILRRSGRIAELSETPPRIVRHAGIDLDLDRHLCSFEGIAISLTVTEFLLLQSLSGMPGKVYTREELVDRAWGRGHHITDRTIDSHIRRIRRKFREAGGDPIETVFGLGYRLREAAAPRAARSA